MDQPIETAVFEAKGLVQMSIQDCGANHAEKADFWNTSIAPDLVRPASTLRNLRAQRDAFRDGTALPGRFPTGLTIHSCETNSGIRYTFAR